MSPRSHLQGHVTAHYDRAMYGFLAQEAYQESDYQNLGYWAPGTTALPQACENLVEKLLDFLPERGGRILDVACGKGATTRHLARYWPAAAIAAINISQRQLHTARRNAPGCALAAMDAARLAFRDGSFDNVLCVEAACHFNTRESFLAEACRVLAPGGRLAFSDLLLTRWMERRAAERAGANFLAGPRRYRSLCLTAGFAEAEVSDASEECWMPYVRQHLRFLANQLSRGALPRRSYRWAMAYLLVMIMATRHYVVGWARKG